MRERKGERELGNGGTEGGGCDGGGVKRDTVSKGWRLGRRGKQTKVEHAAHIIALACVSHRHMYLWPPQCKHHVCRAKGANMIRALRWLSETERSKISGTFLTSPCHDRSSFATVYLAAPKLASVVKLSVAKETSGLFFFFFL